VKYIFQYPEVHGSDRSVIHEVSIPEMAATVESTGWHGLSFSEHPAPSRRWLEAGGHQTFDPFVALAAAAAVTSTIRLVTYLTVVPYRNPMILAKAAASVDIVSRGRLTLGVGTGYLKSEFAAVGARFDDRNDRFDEALDALAAHWSGQPFSMSGRDFVARDVVALPPPVQRPIPLWFGGNSTQTLRRVATRGAGWMPLIGPPAHARTTRTPAVSTPEDVAEQVRRLRAFAGSRADSIDIVVAYMDAAIPNGGIERHRSSLARLAEAGATWIVVPGPIGTGATIERFLGDFAERFIN